MKKIKRRKQKEMARRIIRYSKKKYGVVNIKDIYDDFYYESCIYALKILGKI